MLFPRVRSAAVVAAAVLSAALSLSASTWRGEALLREAGLAPWTLGPFRLQPQIVLSDLGYDSNIYHQPEAVGDYSFTAGPRINAFLPIKKKIVFTLSESPRYVYYFETARERAWNNFLSGRAAFLFNRFFVQVGAHADDARQRWSYEIDVRPRLKDTGYDALLVWQPTRKTAFSLGFKRSRFRYEELGDESFHFAERLNRDETAVTLAFEKRLGTRTRFFLEGEGARADFEQPGNPRDALSLAGYGGFEFSAQGRVRGRLRLGWKLFRPRAEGQPEYEGLVGDSSVSVSLLRPLAARASYRRDVRFSVWYDRPYFIEDTAGGGISLYVFRRRIRLDYDYSQIKYDYPDVAAADGGAPLSPARRDRIYMNTVGFFVRVGGNVGLGLRAGRYDRRTSAAGWKASREFVGLNLTYEFQ